MTDQGKDLSELRRHTFGNSVDRYVLKKLVQKIFKKCRCRKIRGRESHATDENSEPKTSASRICPGHERALDIHKTVHDLDVREEGISTLMCYLELHPYEWVENLQPVYATCKLQCYGGPAQLQAVAKKCPPVAVAIAKQKMEGETFSYRSSVEFDIIELSDSMGWDSGPVKRELRLLQWNLQPGGASKTGVMVEFSDLTFHFRSPGDLTEDEMDGVIDFLHHRVVKQEKTELFQLDLLHSSLKSAAHRNYWMCCDEANMAKSDKLRGFIEDYFENDKSVEMRMSEAEENSLEDSTSRDLGQLVLDIRQFINLYGHEHSLNGRVIARVFHGIASPCFPSLTWGRVRRFWRCHLGVDFNSILKIATKELIGLR
ncbi:ATP-dependent DNA helicase Q4-like [Gigantopelta aegis]|uniref:ATP-dependent DNA helicase Q4-like n=1 Tax=Gigantopelta aegis TaxID=1735272 RepID=UPI001B889E80|nr:ATP-dependent DNA helicase Q4-like [Gigantopelta aegis]